MATPNSAPDPSKVNVLLLGTGGREHAIALKLRQSPRLGELYVQPDANAGLRTLGKPIGVPIDIKQIYRLQQFCDQAQIGLVVVGPEGPLADGYADQLATKSRLVFGPVKAGARIEADKAYCKELMRAASIPTGEAKVFTDPGAAMASIEAGWLAEEDLWPLRALMESLPRAADQRRAIEAMLRIGRAIIDRATFASADLTLVSELLRGKGPPIAESTIRERASTLAKAYRVARLGMPVIKASGLAAGKGVILPSTLEEAAAAIEQIMVKRIFGDAGATVVIEERLKGREVSVLAITDGSSILVLPPCQDHKRLLDHDEGPNTGGMGVYCPSDAIDPETMARIERDVLVAILDVMRREGIEYKGVLYAGLMLTPGGPKVLEFNCRFGDPECQPLMARMETDLLELMLATCEGRLAEIDVQWSDEAACCVVMASAGYPSKPRVGDVISGLEEAASMPGVTVHHAGTKQLADGDVVTSGGRVLGVTAVGTTLEAARERAYAACERIRFEGAQYRRDIGVAAIPSDQQRRAERATAT
jgi:phosphoribosylamine--glycine ligase